MKVIGPSGGNSPAKFSASQVGIGAGPVINQDTDMGLSNGGFGNSFSTQPIKVENKFDSFKALQTSSISNGFSEPKSWESQGINNDNRILDDASVSAGKWDNDEEPVVFGRNDNGIYTDEDGNADDSMEEEFRKQNDEEEFQNDDLVQGFNAGNQDDERN